MNKILLILPFLTQNVFATISECQSDATRYNCLGSDLEISQCLIPNITSLSESCRTRIIALNPNLASELSIKSSCSTDIIRLCPNTTGMQTTQCLENGYQNLQQSGCLATLERENSAFAARMQTIRQTAQNEQAQLQIQQEQQAMKASKQALTAEQEAIRLEKYNRCLARVQPERRNGEIYILDVRTQCDELSRQEPLSPDAISCLTNLMTRQTRALRISEQDKIFQELSFTKACRESYRDTAWINCMQSKLAAGRTMDFYINVPFYCSTRYRACQAELTSARGANNSSTRRFANRFCDSYSDAYHDDTVDCIERDTVFWEGFYKGSRNTNRFVQERRNESVVKCNQKRREAEDFRNCIANNFKINAVLRSNFETFIKYCNYSPSVRTCIERKNNRSPISRILSVTTLGEECLREQTCENCQQ